MPLSSRVHLLLQHPLVDGADGVLRPAEDLGAGPLRLTESELGDGAADTTLDALGPKGDLVVSFALAPLLRPVCVADGHPHDRDGGMDSTDREHPWNPPPGAHDHLAADRLPENPVRGADVVAGLGCDGRSLEPEPMAGDRCGGLSHDVVPGRAPLLEGEVEPRQLELQAEHVGLQHPERRLEQFLTGLVALEDDDRTGIHRRPAV